MYNLDDKTECSLMSIKKMCETQHWHSQPAVFNIKRKDFI